MRLRKVVAVGALMLAFACTSAPLTIKTDPIGPNEKIVGSVEGSSTGLMLFQLIPIRQNSRFVNAYSSALSRAPGATRIIDPVVTEHWFWAYVLNGFTFHVTGTAVGPK